MKYRHIETGKVYEVIDKQILFIEKASLSDNLHTIIYTDENKNIYCRDENMFFKKFEKIKEKK